MRILPPKHPPIMETCPICDRSLAGGRLIDGRTGHGLHPGCVGSRAPHDATVALLGVLAIVLVPTVMVWAG
jgi:hypothetical protein